MDNESLLDPSHVPLAMLAGIPLTVSRLGCFRCANPETWTRSVIAFGYVALCETHAAVFSAEVAVYNAGHYDD